MEQHHHWGKEGRPVLGADRAQALLMSVCRLGSLRHAPVCQCFSQLAAIAYPMYDHVRRVACG